MHVGTSKKRAPQGPVLPSQPLPPPPEPPAPIVFLVDAPEVDCTNCSEPVTPQADAVRTYFYCQRCGLDWRVEHPR